MATRLLAQPERRLAIRKIALYLELKRIETITSETMLAQIRFQWWRDTLEIWLSDRLEDTPTGIPPHPLIALLADVQPRAAIVRQTLDFVSATQACLVESSFAADVYGHLFVYLCDEDLCDPEQGQDVLQRAGRFYGGARHSNLRTAVMSRADLEHLFRISPMLGALLSLSPLYESGRMPGPMTKRFRLLRTFLSGPDYLARVLNSNDR